MKLIPSIQEYVHRVIGQHVVGEGGTLAISYPEPLRLMQQCLVWVETRAEYELNPGKYMTLDMTQARETIRPQGDYWPDRREHWWKWSLRDAMKPSWWTDPLQHRVRLDQGK